MEAPKKPLPDITRITLPEIKPLGRTQLFNIGEKYLKDSKKLLSKRGGSLASIASPSADSTITTRKYIDYLQHDARIHFNSKRDQKGLDEVQKLVDIKQKNSIREAVAIAQKL